MGNFEALARRFAEANLRAEVIEQAVPQRGGVVQDPPGIFQMDVAGHGRDEWFRIWPGARGNRVEALGLDRDQRQLVLLVHEPVRTFTQQLRKRTTEVDRRTVKVVAEDEDHVWVERKTDARKRHFLCGRDERQLFICPLPRPLTTVRDAHAALRVTVPSGVKGKRQGEWFFLPPSANELAALYAALHASRAVVRTRVPIGRGGNPHVADELVRVPQTVVGEVLVPPTLLVRGRVRHVTTTR
ncbi:MAG TPA: hypothetical protein VEB43_11880 [Anaeromyxobacter sp.]|nr:hypothetical protein [Anaeromyxobacter sp.]